MLLSIKSKLILSACISLYIRLSLICLSVLFLPVSHFKGCSIPPLWSWHLHPSFSFGRSGLSLFSLYLYYLLRLRRSLCLNPSFCLSVFSCWWRCFFPLSCLYLSLSSYSCFQGCFSFLSWPSHTHIIKHLDIITHVYLVCQTKLSVVQFLLIFSSNNILINIYLQICCFGIILIKLRFLCYYSSAR